MRIKLGILCLMLVAVTHADDASLEKNDFAYGMTLKLDDKAAIYQLALPQEVYKYVQSDNFSDIRVFNAAGEVVPHMLRRHHEPVVIDSDPVEVPFYPYSYTVVNSGQSASSRVHITINAHGTVVDAVSSPDIASSDRINAYLLDISQFSSMPSKLVLNWENTRDNFVADITVEGSNDLDHWQLVKRKTSLVRLMYAGRQFSRDEIMLPGRHYKYLKINWPTTKENSPIIGIKAHFTPERKTDQPHWVLLTGSRVDTETTSFEYRMDTRYPVTWGEVVLPEENSLADVRLFSRKDDQQPWRLRYAGNFYRLSVEGAKLQSDAISLPYTQDPYWRIEVTSDMSALGPGAPLLKLGFQPHQLYFLARGVAPFTLAFGAHNTSAVKDEINSLLARINDEKSDTFIANASAHKFISLGGNEKLSVPSAPFPWQRVILWSVLVFGVLILGALAWRLSKQMQSNRGDE